MKGIRIGLIVILSAITISMCGILVCGMNDVNMFRNPNRQNYKDVQIVLEKEVPLDGISSISIMYGMNNNDIYFFESETDAVTIKEYSSSEMNDNELSTIRVNENSLEVKGIRRSYSSGVSLFGFNGCVYDRHYTEVYLPTSYHGEILLETASGDIVSNVDFELEKDFSAASTSGDVSFPSVTAVNATINTSSGYVIMENIDTNVNGSVGEICIKTSSGDINLKEIIGETNIASSSGNQTIETLAGDAQLKTTSGDVNIQYMDGNVQVVTASGYVKILEGEGDRSVSTSSGDIVSEGAEGNFQINTQSGNVQMNMRKGEGSIETTSGDVQLGLEELAGLLSINSSSGCVNIKISAENEFAFEADTSSGDITTFFNRELQFSSREDHVQGTYGTDTQGNRMEIRTTSGDIRISKY